MSTEDYEEELKAFEGDPRAVCKYGIKCYQKNPNHHAKYKHPPKKQKEDKATELDTVTTGTKRSSSECDDDLSDETAQPRAKLQKNDKISAKKHEHDLSRSPSPTENISNNNSKIKSNAEQSQIETLPPSKNLTTEDDSSVVDSTAMAKGEMEKDDGRADAKSKDDSHDSSLPHSRIIRKLFLTRMPDDFYKFYDFCRTLTPDDPSCACKLVDLKLVGPYDVLNGRITEECEKEPQKYLRHWRYYYDPPEFQTILKGNDKDGLHYGYWRDNIDELPIFVAKNSANENCNIQAVAPNIFVAVNKHISERVAKATPFEKGPMLKLSKQLTAFAKENGISLDTESSQMRSRKRNVVATTFHGVGVVVPYDKKTQLGYRDLAATDNQLKKILKRIDEAKTDAQRRESMVSLEEVVRLATIAADECDFGTCLELGHDLFSSGVVHVQRIGLQMLAAAYRLLNRQKFIDIAEAHAKDRKKGSDLDVLSCPTM